MNKIFAYIALGTSIVGFVPFFTAELKVPSTLDGPTVWAQVQPILQELAQVVGKQINMDLAQKITLDAVQTIKDTLSSTVKK